jgi:hypothetical protein
MLNMNADMSKKPIPSNALLRFYRILTGGACVKESGFVNHVWLVSRISLFQGVLMGRRCGVPT